METIALITLVSGLGYYFTSDTKNTKDIKNAEMIRNISESDPEPNTMPEIEKPVSINIYNSNMQE